MSRPDRSLATTAIHAGEPEPRIDGSVAMPIFQSSTYIYGGEQTYDASRYVRISNTPNHEALHRKLAALERAEAALVTGSGMAAISAALLSVLSAGDQLLIVDSPYGGTRNFVTEDLPRFGIDVTFIDPDDPADWEAKRTPAAKAIYVESITNPLMQVPDLPAAVAFAKTHGLVSMIDNTLTSPVNFRPAEHGFDLALHSATKYLNGHSDVAAGAVVGRKALVDAAHHVLNHLGGMLDPHACVLLHRGIKTLPLRVRHQNESTPRIAAFLEGHEAVKRVNYPGLPAHPGHARARELFDGFSGMMSFELTGGREATDRFIERLTLPLHAVSLGGVESLIILPARTAYANVPPAERRRLGVTDDLLRLSGGIEDTDELIEDLGQALEAAVGVVVEGN
jgi:cystathionine beta-lyase/cystathionine gamma-synthase